MTRMLSQEFEHKAEQQQTLELFFFLHLVTLERAIISILNAEEFNILLEHTCTPLCDLIRNGRDF